MLNFKDRLIFVMAVSVFALSLLSFYQYKKLKLAAVEQEQAVIQERMRVLEEQKKVLQDYIKKNKKPIAKPISDSEIEKFWNERLNK